MLDAMRGAFCILLIEQTSDVGGPLIATESPQLQGMLLDVGLRVDETMEN